MSSDPEPAMDIAIRNVPRNTDKWQVALELAKVLHNHPFKQPRPDRPLNFHVRLFHHPDGTLKGDGILSVPYRSIGRQFLWHVKDNRIKIRGQKLSFKDKHSQPTDKETAMLQKAPWMDPLMEQEREIRVNELQVTQGTGLRVERVQFGVLFQERDGRGSRKYSVEWEKEYSSDGQAWLKFEYDHKLLKIEVGDRLTSNIGSNIVLPFASISKIAVGNDYKYGFIIFDTHTPPILEEVDFHRSIDDNERDGKGKPKFKRRIGSVERHEAHARVAPYAHTLRLLLNDHTEIDQFRELSRLAELKTRIMPAQVEASSFRFFSVPNLRQWSMYTAKCPWPVAFQLESLLWNGLIHVQDLLELRPQFDALRDHPRTPKLLQKFNEILTDPGRDKTQSFHTDFQRLLKEFKYKEKLRSSGNFSCYHVIFTPTRGILEGPYPTDSNRIVRRYAGYEDNFIRVAFCDEDRLRLRWDRDFDGHRFLEERIGGILQGFQLGGRHFEFLAYSSSALREHSVWFMTPFNHPNEGLVTAQKIRDSIGDFAVPEGIEVDLDDPPLIYRPSKYAARLAQAFTATESSVKIRKGEWEIIPDMGKEPYLHTDGVGTISEGLGDEIWEVLCRARLNRGERAIKPSAYQIRFLGSKGVVVVDRQLDRTPGNIRMRIRPSMRKFENSSVEEADIEIALAFEAPMAAYFNRPLIMILEDRGVSRDIFLELLHKAEADAKLIDSSLSKCREIITTHSYGNAFHFSWILEQLEKRDGDFAEPASRSQKKTNVDSQFFQGLRNVSRMQVLKEIKHEARIPIPESYLLAGVADEGPAYVDDPNIPEFNEKNTCCLPENNIYACIQRPGDAEPTWIEGACLIWRSPLVHPGDVQRVNAIGKPPKDKECLFGHLKNVVVLPSRGRRSLASCLGGGDLDGDTFTVCNFPDILPSLSASAASYPPVGTHKLDRPSTIEDVHRFIVEYFNSDVLGILSDNLLVIADQSERGFFDSDCEKIANLCSQAVDYPKNGIAVDIKGMPRPLIRTKPDWHKAEVSDPRKTDYYESTKALGHMYRAIKLSEMDDPTETKRKDPFEFRTEDITQLLQKDVLSYLPLFDECQRDEDVESLLQGYIDGLRYISAIHTLSNDASVRLSEEEIVLGVILANCSERRWRRERMYRMRTHTSTLIKETKQGFLPPDRVEKPLDKTDREALVYVLEKAWYAWMCRQDAGFGVNSFRLVALGSVLDCLEKLGETCPSVLSDTPSMPSASQAQSESPSSIPKLRSQPAAPVPTSNIGHKLLVKQGWNPGTGLGVAGEGRVEPLQPKVNHRRSGLGLKR
uniref:RNA-dependent RNA polymerase n=1 Tax=Rhodocollybia butyracea TaxID=206335 RepID=A0A9P5UD77_9AGAR|nr:RNA dependent RNA polymerase-domain-containing protein [Rhodocollybia butyracea]